MFLICADIQYLECDTSMGMQTNLYCTSESCYIAFARNAIFQDYIAQTYALTK